MGITSLMIVRYYVTKPVGGKFSAYLILPMGLLLMKFTYCRMVSALILPMILANKPFVIFA